MKKKKLDPETRLQHRADFCLTLRKQDGPAEFVELKFDHNFHKDQYAVGSGQGADTKLSGGSEIAPIHAIIKREEQFSLAALTNPELRKKVTRILKFATNFHVRDSVFKVQNEAEHGTLIYRKQEFVVTPNTMELFQFGNLLLQLSRY